MSLIFSAASQGPGQHQARSRRQEAVAVMRRGRLRLHREAPLAQTAPRSPLGAVLPVPTGDPGAKKGNQR